MQLGEQIACLTQKRQELHDQVKENIKEAQKKQKEVYDRKHTDPPKFAVGTIVLKKDFRRKKRKGGCLDYRWVGPYKILKDVGKGFYFIQNVDNEKNPVRIHGVHLKPYNTPAETPKPDTQDSSNESHQDQGHESSHNSHLTDDSSSSASSLYKASTEVNVIKDNENDNHISHIKSPFHKRSMLQQSSPQAYDPTEFSNSECDNAFVASDLHDCSDNTEFQISLHDSNHDQFICSTLFECGGYFPSFVPIYPKTLSAVSPIKHVSFQSNENEGM